MAKKKKVSEKIDTKEWINHFLNVEFDIKKWLNDALNDYRRDAQNYYPIFIEEDERPFRGTDTIWVISHEEIISESEKYYSQTICYPSLISANTLILQLVALVGIAIILVIIPKKKISSKF